MRTTISRGKIFDDLYCIEQFKKSTIKVNKHASFRYERLRQNDYFKQYPRNSCP